MRILAKTSRRFLSMTLRSRVICESYASELSVRSIASCAKNARSSMAPRRFAHPELRCAGTPQKSREKSQLCRQDVRRLPDRATENRHRSGIEPTMILGVVYAIFVITPSSASFAVCEPCLKCLVVIQRSGAIGPLAEHDRARRRDRETPK